MQSGCCLPPLHDFILLAVQMTLALSVQVPGGCLGQQPLAAPTTSLACPPVKHAMISTLPFPGSLGAKGCKRLSSTPVPARNISLLKSSRRWGSSGGRHSNSCSPPSILELSKTSCIMPSIPQVSQGIRWVLSTLASLSGLSSEDEGASPQQRLHASLVS